ncbi:hypothetical protein FBU30_002289, partial [Linnemannia zychae]
MGIEGAFRFLDEEGIEPPQADMQLVRNAHVDILGAYYSYICRTGQSQMLASFRDGVDEALDSLTRSIHAKLKHSFTPDSVVLHFDGSATVEKSKARKKRKDSRDKYVTEMHDQAQKLRDIMNSAGYSKTTKRRLVRTLRHVKSKWASARGVDRATRTALASSLEHEGWNVCRCLGEADVCIGQVAKNSSSTTVAVSNDSDHLFHGCDVLYRWNGNGYSEYNIEKIIQQLNVTWEQWVTAAICTSNNYTTHATGQSFKKNMGLLRQCNANTIQGVLQQYCEIIGVSPSSFDESISIFIHKTETIEKENDSNDTDVDRLMQDTVTEVTQYFREFKRHDIVRKSRQAELPKPETAKPKWLFGNEYKPRVFNHRATDLDYQDPTPPRKRKRKSDDSRKKKKTVMRNPSSKVAVRTLASRRVRQQEEAQDEGSQAAKKGRKRNPGNMIGDVLGNIFAMTSMNLGTIHHRLSRGLQLTYHADDYSELSQHIESTIEGLAKLNTDLIRCGSIATFNYINTIMATYSSVNPNSGDIERRRLLFKHISNESGFFKTLVKGLYHWDDEIKGSGE